MPRADQLQAPALLPACCVTRVGCAETQFPLLSNQGDIAFYLSGLRGESKDITYKKEEHSTQRLVYTPSSLPLCFGFTWHSATRVGCSLPGAWNQAAQAPGSLCLSAKEAASRAAEDVGAFPSSPPQWCVGSSVTCRG